MGQFFDSISDDHAEWIKKQKIFFVATAPASVKGTVNTSPKGYDSLRILGPNAVCYLELSGSGIETQSHLEENGRITLMLLAFEGGPRIMRLIGRGRVVRLGSPEYNDIISAHYQNPESQPVVNSVGCRGIIMVDVRKVGTSCGYAVPYFDYKGPRPTLLNGFAKKEEEKVTDYWRTYNAVSLDGLPGMRHERMGPEWLGSYHRTALTLDENIVGYEADGPGSSALLMSLSRSSKNWTALIAPRLLIDLVVLTTGICIGVLATRRR
ncbi:hypothetical protein EMPS_05867 [Entomortierella parvispora]|uniref:Pyridoxamine 5'-phosphate oxidase putative domain-containing protein n=1 Tax=Entomortierella parvispora TaxID=205924 RepID=A0A9P3LWX1_9FUNG|nr:hypothetical protein EMPS_05867 [Entomortierella parvispora]